MLALTIRQPWASCVAHGPKDIENRTWFPPRKWRLPLQLAIHSSARHAKGDEAYLTERIAKVWPEVRDVPIVRGAVIAVATLVSVVRHLPGDPNPWAMGPWCWHLEDVRALPEPVPCKGRQSLWPLPRGIEVRVLEQLGTAMSLPPTARMVRALKGIGRRLGNDAIRSWRCGRNPAPAWAIAAIAKHTGCDVGELTEEFARRWEEKHR